MNLSGVRAAGAKIQSEKVREAWGRWSGFVRGALREPVMAFDIGAAAVKAVCLEKEDGAWQLRYCASRDMAGLGLEAAVSGLLAEAPVKTKRAALAVSSPEVSVKPFSFPNVPDKELPGAIRLEAETMLVNGHTLDEMALDWHLLSAAQQAERQGIIALLPRQQLEAQLQLAKRLGLQPVLMDVEGLALWNAFAALSCDAPDQSGRLSDARSEEPLHASIAQQSAGGPSLSETTVLLNIGASKTHFIMGSLPDTLLVLREVQHHSAEDPSALPDDWYDEMQATAAYARSLHGRLPIQSVRLTGGGAGKADAARLEKILRAKVSAWNPLLGLKPQAGNADAEKDGALFGVALGLGLRT